VLRPEARLVVLRPVERGVVRERAVVREPVLERAVDRVPERELDAREREPVVRRADVRVPLDRRRAPLRSAAGTSAWTTDFVSVGISRDRKSAMRSSCRRMARAIFAVSLSPTESAKVSIAL
jgi:hypothetical protein